MKEKVAGATGLEPATFGVTGRRSNQLNYALFVSNSLTAHHFSALTLPERQGQIGTKSVTTVTRV
jgi:hypothetical protein